MQTFEFFSSLVQFDLSGLSLCDFLLELLCFASDFDGKFLDLKSKLLDFSLISTSELFESQVVLFFLAGGESPLLKFLLIPIHLELELVHTLVCLEDHILNVVQTILLVSNPLLKLLNLVAQTARLSFGDLFQMLLSLDFFVLGVNKTLSMNKLHLD